jgi:hypothetical protein
VTSKPTLTSVQIDFSQSSFARLKVLKEKTKAVDYAEVIGNALQLYEALIEEYEKGTQFLKRSKTGQIEIYQMFKR